MKHKQCKEKEEEKHKALDKSINVSFTLLLP